MYASAKDLRFYSKNLLDVVSRGEEVIITYRGKPCAKLAPQNHKRILSSASGKIINLPTMWINMLEIYAKAGPNVD
jgi:prevent-host-death family protein